MSDQPAADATAAASTAPAAEEAAAAKMEALVIEDPALAERFRLCRLVGEEVVQEPELLNLLKVRGICVKRVMEGREVKIGVGAGSGLTGHTLESVRKHLLCPNVTLLPNRPRPTP
jgi:hypothetical protein